MDVSVRAIIRRSQLLYRETFGERPLPKQAALADRRSGVSRISMQNLPINNLLTYGHRAVAEAGAAAF